MVILNRRCFAFSVGFSYTVADLVIATQEAVVQVAEPAAPQPSQVGIGCLER